MSQDAKKEPSSWNTWLQGLFIISLGGAFSFAGFKYGLRQQFDQAKNEFDDRQVVKIDYNKVGPSGVPARELATKAFLRGSAAAVLIAAVAGIGLSFAVEAKHKGVTKEQEQAEMRVLYKELGILDDMEDKTESKE